MFAIASALGRGLFTAAAGLLLAGSAISAERDFPVSDRAALDDVYPERKVSFADGVTGYPDVVYSTLPGFRPLVVDIYTPPDGATRRPLVLFIHGGGWTGGHTRHSGALSDFPGVLAKLASEGFVVASLEYRLTGEAPFPAQLQDARAALRYLKANAAKYGIDPSRTGVWGGSAGGHLAALAALSCGETGVDPAPAPPGSECVQAAVIWYGVFDFAPMLAREAGAPSGDNAMNALLRCRPAECPESLVAQASPASHINAGDPPFLLIHGENDRVVPVAQSRDAERALKAAGVPVESIYVPGADHSFVAATPAATRAATLKATNATFDFFHKRLLH
jgi:acetyl esterase/lipase